MKFPDIGGKSGQSNGAGKLFVRMVDGDKISGVFRGDPHIYRLHWEKKKSYTCLGKTECERCAAGDKPKFRFKINFMMKEDGVWLAKIFENSYGTFKDMKAMHESDYDLEKTLVVITRQGDGTNTRYNILPARTNLPPKDFQKFESIPLNPLKDGADASAPDPADQVFVTDDDIPF